MSDVGATLASPAPRDQRPKAKSQQPLASSQQRHAVAHVAEIPPGARLIVEIAGRSIGVFNVDGRFLRGAQ